jgi:hypothetical protein
MKSLLKRSGMTGTSGSEARRMVESGDRCVGVVEMLEEVVVVVFVALLSVLSVDEVRKGPL